MRCQVARGQRTREANCETGLLGEVKRLDWVLFSEIIRLQFEKSHTLLCISLHFRIIVAYFILLCVCSLITYNDDKTW